MGRISDEERSSAVEFIPAEGNAPNPDDASEQWADFESFRDQGESGSRGMVTWVYRIPTDAVGNPVTNAQSELLFTAPIDVYDPPQIFERVKREYMPRGFGRSLVRVMIRREKQAGVLWQKVFVIIKGARDDEPDTTRGVGPNGEPNSIQAMAQMFNETLKASQEQNRQLLATILQRANPAAQADPMAQTERMLAMVTGLTAAINTGRAPVAAGGIGEMATTFREMMKLTREFGGGDSGGGNDDGEEGGQIVGIIKALAPWADTFKTMIAAQAAQPPALPAPQPQRRVNPAGVQPLRREPPRAPRPQAAPGAGQPQPQRVRQPAPSFENRIHQSKGDPMLMKIVEMTNDLIALKEGGGDPEAIGKTMSQIMPPEMEDRILDLLASPDWFTKLGGFNPKVKEHHEFFQKVRDSVLAEYEFSDGEGGEPGSDDAEIPGGDDDSGGAG